MPSIKTFNAESRKYGDRIWKFAPLTKDTIVQNWVVVINIMLDIMNFTECMDLWLGIAKLQHSHNIQQVESNGNMYYYSRPFWLLSMWYVEIISADKYF